MHTPMEKMDILAKRGFVQKEGVWVKPSSNNVGWSWNITVTEGDYDKATLKDQHGREQYSVSVDYDLF